MRYAAFLRGINLGGRRATGEQLCAPFGELGFARVASFLASGNVVFDADVADDAEDLEPRIEEALEAALGYPVESFVRTASELQAVLSREPFAAEEVEAATGKPQVTFLRSAPDADSAAAVHAHDRAADRVVVAGREWYWLPAAGISKSDLDVDAIERTVGRGTTRTINTVERLVRRLMSPVS